MINHILNQVVKKIDENGNVISVFIQITISDGSNCLCYDKTFDASILGDLENGIQNWAAEKHKEFLKTFSPKVDIQLPKFTFEKVNTATIKMDSDLIVMRASKLGGVK